jgi:hypothetical protein
MLFYISELWLWLALCAHRLHWMVYEWASDIMHVSPMPALDAFFSEVHDLLRTNYTDDIDALGFDVWYGIQHHVTCVILTLIVFSANMIICCTIASIIVLILDAIGRLMTLLVVSCVMSFLRDGRRVMQPKVD